MLLELGMVMNGLASGKQAHNACKFANENCHNPHKTDKCKGFGPHPKLAAGQPDGFHCC